MSLWESAIIVESIKATCERIGEVFALSLSNIHWYFIQVRWPFYEYIQTKL